MKVDYESLVGKSLGMPEYKGAYVGLELEYEKCKPLDEISKWWHTDIDHSLRAGGLEFVSRPLHPDKVHEAVAEMLAMAKGVLAHVTPRCGLHVHLNVTDLTWSELYRLTTYYTLLEPHLFKEMAPGREMSHFCVPTWTNTALTEYMYNDGQRLRNGIIIPGTQKSTSWAKAAAYLVGGLGLGHNNHRLRILGTPKYAALNMASLKKFGTLEFRQAPSSLDPVFIEAWATILINIREEALKYDDATDIIRAYDRYGIFTLCERVGLFPTKAVDELDQEDAVDAATVMAGHLPVNWKELTWELS